MKKEGEAGFDIKSNIPNLRDEEKLKRFPLVVPPASPRGSPVGSQREAPWGIPLS